MKHLLFSYMGALVVLGGALAGCGGDDNEPAPSNTPQQNTDACGTGFQDKDGDGVCAPACGPDSCEGNRVCSDATGQIECACARGYTGANCDQCADGYEKQGSECVSNLCKDKPCTDPGQVPGTCEPTGTNSYKCECKAGHSGALCDDCAAGYSHDSSGACVKDTACTANTCNKHGTCNDSSGSPVCTCDTGYAGDHCDKCASGYQDNDNNHSCLAGCSKASLECGDHSACDDSSGEAVCACETGYQDNDDNGSCEADCTTASLDCGSHGQCKDDSGTASCACDDGYEGDGCDACASGYQDNDSNGTCEPDCTTAALQCNNGSCDDASGSAKCVCNAGYQDNDNNGTCEPTCGTAGETCSNHGTCNDSSGAVACECQAAYAGDSCEQCASGYQDNDSNGTCLPTCATAGFACTNGTCSDTSGQAMCNCNQGYTPMGGECVPDANGHTCATAKPLNIWGGPVTGSTVGAGDDINSACAYSDNTDVAYWFSVDVTTRVTFSVTGFDAVLSLRQNCSSSTTDIECVDETGSWSPEVLQAEFEPGTYYFIVDSYGSSGGGSYTINIDARQSPCADEEAVCPGTPVCQPSADWSSASCVCAAGMVPYNGTCVDDPCAPNPCTQEHKTKCVADLPSSYHCECSPGFIPDTTDPNACMMDPNANEWTFMVYINGDNNLEDDAYDDLAEMQVAGSNPYVNIVVLLDSYSANGGAARYMYVRQGASDVIQNLGEVDMGNWQTLRNFGTWVVDNYPARHYALVMWNHGAGWEKKQRVSTELFKGFSNDDHGNGDGISVSNGDYARALEAIAARAGGKLDLVGFDACLMGMWEVANASAPYAHYLVASEELEPAAGWSYDGFLPQLVADHTMSAAQLGTLIVDSYYNASTSNDTLAVTNLDTIADLNAKVSAFADAMRASTSFYSTIRSIRNQTTDFGYGDPFFDMVDFTTRIVNHANAPQNVKTAGQALITQLNTSIVHNKAHMTGAHGLSIYIPSSSMSSQYRQAGAIWSQLATWDEFLDALY